MPKVSVIIPTYNRQLLLKTAIESVLNQTFADFELIIVNDASDDKTQELVCSFINKKLRYIRHDHNKGEAASRNTGIVNAIGKFVAFLDDDDEWLPEKLALQVDLLEKASSKVGAVYTGMSFVKLADKTLLSKSIPTKRGDIFRDMLYENVVGTPSKVLIRMSCIEKIGLFDETLSYFVDYDYFLRFAKHFNFDYIPKPLVKYHVHDGNLSNNSGMIERAIDSLKRKYSEYHSSTIVHSSFYSKVYLNVGIKHCYNGNMNKGRQLLKMAMKHDPYEWRSYFNLIISILGKRLFIYINNIKNRIGNYTSKFHYC